MTFGTWLLAGVLLAANALPEDVAPMSKRTFDIPIRLDQTRLPELKQLLLFVSTDQGKTWRQQAAVAPESPAFTFTAPAEGEYWFAVCTVNQQGQQDPENVYKATPMKVLVDTLKPDLRVVSAERAGEEVVVKWEVKDANLDPGTLRLEYHTPEAPPDSWTHVPVTAESSQASFRPGTAGAVQYRMEVKDLVGNVTRVSGEVAAAAAGAATASAGPPPPLVNVTPSLPSPTPGSLPVPPPGPLPPTIPPVQQVSQTGRGNPDAPTMWTNPTQGAGVLVNATRAGQPIASSTGGPPPAVAPAGQVFPGAPSMSAPPVPPPPAAPPAPLQIIKDRQLTLQYTVRDVGPSGLGSVELYVTRDDGRSWQLANTLTNVGPAPAADGRGAAGPVLLSLPVELTSGEGIYGFYIVVKSKAGLGAPPPQPGTPPRLRVMLDLTPPEATLFMAPGHRNTLLLTWEARDNNLAARPITLEWAERREGPWKLIAQDLPNTPSSYEWHLPTGTDALPPRVFLRLTARDSAGNVCYAETPDAQLIDLSEPTVENIQLQPGGPVRP